MAAAAADAGLHSVWGWEFYRNPFVILAMTARHKGVGVSLNEIGIDGTSADDGPKLSQKRTNTMSHGFSGASRS